MGILDSIASIFGKLTLPDSSILTVEDIAEIWKSSGNIFRGVNLQHGSIEQQYETISLSDVRRIGNTAQFQKLHYQTNWIECGWFAHVYLVGFCPAFSSKQYAIGWCHANCGTPYNGGHRFIWFINRWKKLEFYCPVKQWPLPYDVIDFMLYAGIN